MDLLGEADARPVCEVRDDLGEARVGRKEKRKAWKKLKRKKWRRQIAEAERLLEEARLQDPEEQLRIRNALELEARQEELERKLHEEQERLWLERERQAQEEFQRKEQERLSWEKDTPREEEEGEYEDGPAEIIWEGNEITIKKTRVKVGSNEKHKVEKAGTNEENKERPTCNPPPPRLSLSQRSVKDEGEQNANYGTEQDKTHCPFHIKTGVCRFGPRCSRLHVYPEKSCTLLIKNMYTGPGLAWEHDEGLECTDEEIAEQFEEFYEDVHSEFLKFGEIVNFKVCRNSSPHLRGNVYIQYKSEDAAIAACLALSGRFYASKQMIPEFVGVTKWKVALCGEYMKMHHGTCSRGAACNFLHCFQNPGGEYDWADRDCPAPRAWKQRIGSLFGHLYSEREVEHESKREDRRHWNFNGRDKDEHHSRLRDRHSRSHSKETTRRRRSTRRDSTSSDDHSDGDRKRRDRKDRKRGNSQRNHEQASSREKRSRSSDRQTSREKRRSRSSDRPRSKKKTLESSPRENYDRWLGGN